MTRDIININDFTILVEESAAAEKVVDRCRFEEPLIGVALYGTGNVNLRVNYAGAHQEFSDTSGLALSFYADSQVEFVHTILPERPLQSIVIATAVSRLQDLPYEEGELFTEMLKELVYPSDHFVKGPEFYMTPAMLQIVEQLFDVQNERLKCAHELLFREHLTVQEAAWDVGYDSVSSFSNAFTKKFGYRPSEVRQ